MTTDSKRYERDLRIMRSNLTNLVRRDDDLQLSHTMVSILITLLILLIVALLLVAGLVVLRHRRRARKTVELPLYSDKRMSVSSTHSKHRRITVRPSQSVHIFHEKQNLIDNSSESLSPSSSLPEIRITFPEEIDATGKRQSGKVVVVRVGDTGVGLEPITESLPAYQSAGERFQSLDLERIGGLTEKKQAPLGWS